MTRKTDRQDESIHFQMNRFALQNGMWYYSTRESAEKGPFKSKDDAENDLASFIDDGQIPGVKRTTDFPDSSIHFQMNRFALQNGRWFYSTREHIERGPFNNKDVAESDLAAYIYHRHNIERYSH